MSKANIDVVKKIYTAFGQGNIPAVLALFDPSIEWVAAENSPLADRSPYRGLNQVVEGVFTRIGVEFPGLTIQVDELLDAGDKIVMLGRYHGVRKTTGKDSRRRWLTSGRSRPAKSQSFSNTWTPIRWLKRQNRRSHAIAVRMQSVPRNLCRFAYQPLNLRTAVKPTAETRRASCSNSRQPR